MTTCAENAALLAAAKAALHGALLGGKVKSIQDGENRIEYTATTVSDLRAYVRSLQAIDDACNGTARPGRAILFMPSDD